MRTLCFKHIGDLSNGEAEKDINDAINFVLQDIEKRGDDKLPREVQITMTIKPQKEDELAIQVSVGKKTPKSSGGVTVAKIQMETDTEGMPQAVAVFQEASAENPDQNTLEFAKSAV